MHIFWNTLAIGLLANRISIGDFAFVISWRLDPTDQLSSFRASSEVVLERYVSFISEKGAPFCAERNSSWHDKGNIEIQGTGWLFTLCVDEDMILSCYETSTDAVYGKARVRDTSKVISRCSQLRCVLLEHLYRELTAKLKGTPNEILISSLKVNDRIFKRSKLNHLYNLIVTSRQGESGLLQIRQQ